MACLVFDWSMNVIVFILMIYFWASMLRSVVRLGLCSEFSRCISKQNCLLCSNLKSYYQVGAGLDCYTMVCELFGKSNFPYWFWIWLFKNWFPSFA
jgi:hypothetical protein